MLFQALCVKSFLVCSGSILPMKVLTGQVVKPATEVVESTPAHSMQQDVRLDLVIEDSSEVDICSPMERFHNLFRLVFLRILG